MVPRARYPELVQLLDRMANEIVTDPEELAMAGSMVAKTPKEAG